MPEQPRFQRDVFIDEIFAAAKTDRDIVFISADFGAPSLDRYRTELPDQFIHSGISEQHMIEMAAGLALAGKKVYAYAMAPFISLRCYEQLKCSLAMMDQPVTVIGVGVGLGYADSGPTHYLTEDIACMRALVGIEVLTAADAVAASRFARLTVDHARLRYIRLDRDALPDVHDEQTFGPDLDQGYRQLLSGTDVCLVSSGYTLHRALDAGARLGAQGVGTSVVDLFRVKPIDFDALAPVLEDCRGVVTIEEQCLAGGLGSALGEVMADNGMSKPLRRLGLPERFYFENGGRDYLLDRFGLSVDDICDAARKIIA